MKDKLPKNIKDQETGIVNLDNDHGAGTHWVAYSKKDNLVTYFDSYGDLQPPIELIKYFRGSSIQYNYISYQQSSYVCGHLCLLFLYREYN